MNRLISRLTIVSLLIALMGGATLRTAAEAEKTPTEKKAATEKKATTDNKAAESSSTRYRGTVVALDKTALTLTITNKSSSRVFQITSDTKLFKKDKPATLAEIVIGDVVGGSYITNADKFHLLTVRDAGPDEKTAKQAEKKAEGAANADKAQKKEEKKSEK